MRTVELVAPRRLELNAQPIPPDPGPGEVMVRLHAVGLCGSDLHWYQDGRVGHNHAVYPMVLGHEPVGEVVAIGPGVESHKLGDRVAIEPSIVCGHCEYCRSGYPNNCVSGVFMGGPTSPGFFREYAVVPCRNAEHFPSHLDYATATLIEPVAVIMHVFDLTTLRPGDTVAVLGAGPIGLLCANMARLSGASTVILADRVPHRLALGMAIDHTLITVNMHEASLADAVGDVTAGRGVDIVFDAAAAPATRDAGLAIVRPGGQYVLVGIPGDAETLFDLQTAMNKEVRIQTIKRSNHCGHRALEWIEAGKVPSSIITHRLDIEQTPEAFELVSEYRDGVGKLIIEMEHAR